jgi:hypothetical protein
MEQDIVKDPEPMLKELGEQASGSNAKAVEAESPT